MEAIIRPGRATDYKALKPLFEQLDDQHHQALPDFFRPAEEINRSQRFVNEILVNDESELFVAEVEGKIVGLVHIAVYNRDHPSTQPIWFGYIHDIVLKRAYQGHGISQQLLSTAVNWAKQRHEIVQIQLNVFEFNQRAIAFYEKFGFITNSRHMWFDV